jgi:hypothetical protein
LQYPCPAVISIERADAGRKREIPAIEALYDRSACATTPGISPAHATHKAGYDGLIRMTESKKAVKHYYHGIFFAFLNQLNA